PRDRAPHDRVLRGGRLGCFGGAVPGPHRARARDPGAGRPRLVEPPDRRAARPLDQDGPQPRLERLHEDPGRRSGAGDRQGPGGGHRRPVTSAAIEARARTRVRTQAPPRFTVGAVLATGATLLLLAAALTLL